MDNGYTQIPNYLMAVLYGSGLKGSEASVFAYIIRKTVGFHKTKDRLSYSQIMEATNLSEKSVIRAVKSLEDKKIIRVSRKGTKTNLITLASVKNGRRASVKNGNSLLSEMGDTKETQKETVSGFRPWGSTLTVKEREEEQGDGYE